METIFQTLGSLPNISLIWVAIAVIVMINLVQSENKRNKRRSASVEADEAAVKAVPKPAPSAWVEAVSAPQPAAPTPVEEAVKPVSALLQDEYDWSIYDAPAYTRRVR